MLVKATVNTVNKQVRARLRPQRLVLVGRQRAVFTGQRGIRERQDGEKREEEAGRAAVRWRHHLL